MNSNYLKQAIIVLAVLLVMCQPLRPGDGSKDDILVHLRLYEGSRGNEPPRTTVVSSYYLKPLFVSSMVSELDLKEEQKELKRIFNLSNIKLMTRTQWGWKYGKTEKRFRMVVLNGHEFLVQLTMTGKKNGFKVEVMDKSKKGEEPLLETDVELPQKKSTVFGFEDSLRKPFFICLEREENQSIIGLEPVTVPPNKPKLIKRIKPVYPAVALDRKLQGDVIMDVLTNKNGMVQSIKVVDGVKGLNKAAMDAVKKWKYEPYVVNGKARQMRFTVVVHFSLPVSVPAADVPVPAGGGNKFIGESMSFHFQDADLFDVLKYIAKKVVINIVVDPGIKGRISANLENVPWDQALDLMLRVNGLDMIHKGNVLRILKADPANIALKESIVGKTYSGTQMEFNFENADLNDVLKTIARIAGLNLELGPNVSGKVTTMLNEVAWDQALDLLLQLNGLDMMLEGKSLTIFKPEKTPIPDTKDISKNVPNILPVRGFLKDGFGFRTDVRTGKRKFHNGVDIAAKEGTEVKAPADGVVLVAGFRDLYGNLMIIDHGNGYTSRYGEMSAFKVVKGQKVKKGQVIGFVGNSGTKAQFHLHYEVRYHSKPINPLTLIREK